MVCSPQACMVPVGQLLYDGIIPLENTMRVSHHPPQREKSICTCYIFNCDLFVQPNSQGIQLTNRPTYWTCWLEPLLNFKREILWGVGQCGGGREQNLILRSMLAVCQSTPEEFGRAKPGMQPHLERLSDDRESILEAATCWSWLLCRDAEVWQEQQVPLLCLDCSIILWFRRYDGGRWNIVCLLHSNISKWFILIIFRLQYVASYVKCTLKSN